jgi:hypothetical protein
MVVLGTEIVAPIHLQQCQIGAQIGAYDLGRIGRPVSVAIAKDTPCCTA